MRISFKQLQVFAAIAKHENISLAADEVALTQSAMSMSLKELESQLNTPLFTRQGKRLKLNNAGSLLQPKVQKLLQLAQEIEQFAKQDELTGQLRIGASSTIGNYLAPAIIAEFLTLFPHLHIDLKVANTEQIIDDMRHMRIDIGLIEGICDVPQLERHAWRDDDLRIFCATSHPLAKKKNISMSDLAEASWILRESGSGTRTIFTNAISQQFQPQAQLLELGNSEAIKQAVKTGFGISCLSEIAIAAELQYKELTVLNIPELDLHRQLFIIKHKSQFNSRVEQAFETLLWKHSNLS
jgi:DNA-binding transcriptional LysR family regulator